MNRNVSLLLALSLVLVVSTVAAGARVGDIATFQGERENYIESVGIVVGLDGTGDSAGAVNQALTSLLKRRQINLNPRDISARNVAIVWVQARLAPYLREGQRIDVTVGSMNDAKSLFGGQLVQTPLTGADGRVYAVAAGAVAVGGFSVGGQAAQVRLNHTLVGRIPNGGIVERELDWKLMDARHSIHLLLRQPDFRNAMRVANAVNQAFPESAAATDAVRVRVRVPEEYREKGRLVVFLAQLMDIAVEPALPCRVVLNERTGTIIAGGEITIGKVAISHGNLSIAIAETPEVSQPVSPFGWTWGGRARRRSCPGRRSRRRRAPLPS
jgi:flagellar P-ring protein precursor FlgI